jgi:hypothetical protein
MKYNEKQAETRTTTMDIILNDETGQKRAGNPHHHSTLEMDIILKGVGHHSKGGWTSF